VLLRFYLALFDIFLYQTKEPKELEMTFFDIFFLAIALSVDAFIVSFSYGLLLKPHRTKNGVILGLVTGFFQFLMPVLGWYCAKSVNKYIESIDHWLAFFVFLALGIKIITDARNKNRETQFLNIKKHLNINTLLMIGIATSIDALVSGATIYFMRFPILIPALIIGLTTFVCAWGGYELCRIFKRLPAEFLEIFAGMILIALGFKILLEHLYF